MGARGTAWLAITGVAAAMFYWSFGTWPNLLVDFGRELYVPWRLVEGEVLYRDIPWFDGPLSAYWNAGVFRVFGVSLRAIVLANLVLVGAFVLLLHALLARAADRLSATVACLVFVSLFAFTRIDTIGNDNYLTPYSHGVTHGLLLSLLGLQLFALRERGRLAAAIGSGLALGLVALTKAEIFVAASAALVCGWALDVARNPGARAVPGFAFLAATVTPPLVAFALLATAMPSALAAAGTLGTWSSLASSSVASQHFYRDTFGTLQLGDNLLVLLRWSVAYLAAIGVLVGLTLQGARRSAGSTRSEAGRALAVGAASAAFVATISAGDLAHARWPDALRPLPLLLLLLIGSAALRRVRHPDGAAASARDVLWLALLVFAFVLLAKIGLRVRLDQYGFALAMPASLLAVCWLVARLPTWIGARGGSERAARAAAVGLVAAVAVSFMPVIAARFGERSVPIGRGADAFLTEPDKASVAARALAALEALPPDATLAVLPEGVMLNFLTRRPNPTGIVNFMPPELIVFGEERILRAFAEHPPDFIALTHKDTQEYGVGFFGRGYGRALHAWVVRNYAPLALFGDRPLVEESEFGIQLLERRAVADAR